MKPIFSLLLVAVPLAGCSMSPAMQQTFRRPPELADLIPPTPVQPGTPAAIPAAAAAPATIPPIAMMPAVPIPAAAPPVTVARAPREPEAPVRMARKPSDVEEEREQKLYLDVIGGLQQRGLHRAALAHIDDYEKQHGRNTRTIAMRADALLAINDLDDAERYYQLLAKTEMTGQANAGLGHVEGARHRWPEAVASFRRAVRAEPTNSRFLNNLGYAELRTGDVRGATNTLLQAEELDPTNIGIRNNVILAMWMAGERDSARGRIARIEAPAERAVVERILAANTGAPQAEEAR